MNQFVNLDEFRNSVLEEAAKLADDHPGVAEAIRDSKKGTTVKITSATGEFVIQSHPVYFTPDPNYNLVDKLPTEKKGNQCGECGMKFDYGQAYGYCCGNTRCPLGYGG